MTRRAITRVLLAALAVPLAVAALYVVRESWLASREEG